MRTMPTCSPFGPTNLTSGTRMRSLMRVSTVMWPPQSSYPRRNRAGGTASHTPCPRTHPGHHAAPPDHRPDCVEVTVTDARAKLPELLDTEICDGAVVYLTRYGRRVGAVVPAEVAERYEQWEDAYWSRRAAEVVRRDEPTVPWE